MYAMIYTTDGDQQVMIDPQNATESSFDDGSFIQPLSSNYITVNEARKLRAQMKKSATKFYILNKILLNKQQKNIQKLEANMIKI